jgi:hypothetical protein
LTPAENENASFAGWSKDKKAMYYISNKRDPRFFDLYKMYTADWKPMMLYENNEGMFVAGMSDDENILVLQKPLQPAISNCSFMIALPKHSLRFLRKISPEAMVHQVLAKTERVLLYHRCG